MLKRICAFCLIMVLTVSLISVMPVSAASDKDIQLIVDLGIINVDEGTGLLPKGFNRADFARSLCLMERNDNPPQVSAEDAKTYASDIETNSNNNYIAAVLSAGYMQTDDAGKFNPSASVSMSDAVPALVRMLGYEPMAQANGGSYNAYYKIALKVGILKGVSVADNAKLTSREVAELLANAMGAIMFLPNNIAYSDDCLWDRWNITVYTGKILANSNMGMLTDRTDPGFVNIDGNVYRTDLLVDNSIIGSKVTYYTMYGDMGDEVVSISVDKYADTIALQSDEVESVSESSRILTIKTDKKKEIKVDKRGFLIVNGTTQSPSAAMFNAFHSGTVTFIDSDKNGVYDVVNMTLLFQTIIDGVNSETKALRTRFDNQTIELENVESYEVFSGKKKAELSELSSGMPVGIACDSFSIVNGNLVPNFAKAEYIQIYASGRKSTGYVTAILGDGGFEMDDMEKELGSGYTRLLAGGFIQPVKIGEYITAYFDNTGKLTYFEIAEGGGMEYGYIIYGGVNRSFGKTAIEIKILDTTGKIEWYSTDRRFVLDGKKVDANSIIYTVNEANDVDLSKRQLIRYRLTDGVLKEIDTQIVRASVENAETSLDASLPFNVGVAGNSKYTVRNGAINRRVAFSKDCVMFVDEALTDEVNPDDSKFSVVMASTLGKGEYYMAGYDSDRNCEIPCIVRFEGYGITSGDVQSKLGLDQSAANCYVVEKVRNACNDDDEWGWQITLAGESTKITCFALPDNLRLYTTRSADDWGGEACTVYPEEPENLTNVIKTGDVIRFKTNTAGDITYIEKMFDFASHKASYTPVPVENGQRYGFAKLEKISGNNIIYSYGDYNDLYISRSKTSYKTVPLYHVSTGEVEMVTLADLPSATTGNDVKCFFRYYAYGEIKDNIFYIYD